MRGVAALRGVRCDEGNAADDQKPKSKEFLGGNAEGVTPVPISNTEVKPLRADDTARVDVWQRRSPQGIISNDLQLNSEMRGVLR